MKKCKVTTLMCALITILPPTMAFANNDFSACNPILSKDIDVGSLNKIQRLAVLSQVSKSDFEEKRKDVGIGTSFIYYGIPISANGNWDEFEVKRNQESGLYKLNISNEEAWTWTKYTTNSQAYWTSQNSVDIQ